MILLITSGINLITSNRPPKKIIQNLTTRTYLKVQVFEAHARVFSMISGRGKLNGKDKFKIETFLPLIDTLSVRLKQQLNSYNDINQLGLFSCLKTLKSAAARQSCKEFAKIYYKGVNEAELKMKYLYLKKIL